MVCRIHHTLPQAGGLLDQDAFMAEVIMAVDDALAEREEIESRRKNKV